MLRRGRDWSPLDDARVPNSSSKCSKRNVGWDFAQQSNVALRLDHTNTFQTRGSYKIRYAALRCVSCTVVQTNLCCCHLLTENVEIASCDQRFCELLALWKRFLCTNLKFVIYQVDHLVRVSPTSQIFTDWLLMLRKIHNFKESLSVVFKFLLLIRGYYFHAPCTNMTTTECKINFNLQVSVTLLDSVLFIPTFNMIHKWKACILQMCEWKSKSLIYNVFL